MIPLLKTKKGYFFLMDGIFAIVILTIGYLMISSNTPKVSSEVPLAMYLDNTIELLSTVRVYELCSDYSQCTCSNAKLSEYCEDGLILNANQTLLDYFGELYYSPDSIDSIAAAYFRLLASDLFHNLTIENNLFRQDIFGVEFKINGEKIYPNFDTDSSKKQSKNLISSRKLILGYYERADTGEVEFWGPYIAEVNVWE